MGAGRIEDTWNLIGRALATVVTCAAQTLGVPPDQVVQAAGLTLLDAPSLKAAPDIDWQDPTAQADALARLLAEVDRLETWVAAHDGVAAAPAVAAALTALRHVLTQHVEPDPTSGQRRIRRGVAPDRQPSLGDPAMRHGRKTKVRTFTGFKRHVMKLVDADVIATPWYDRPMSPAHTISQPIVHAPLGDVEAQGDWEVDLNQLAPLDLSVYTTGGYIRVAAKAVEICGA